MFDLVQILFQPNHYVGRKCCFKDCFPKDTDFHDAVIAFRIDGHFKKVNDIYVLADDVPDLDKDYRYNLV